MTEPGLSPGFRVAAGDWVWKKHRWNNRHPFRFLHKRKRVRQYSPKAGQGLTRMDNPARKLLWVVMLLQRPV